MAAVTRRHSAKTQRLAFIKQQTVDFHPLTALDHLPGDEVDFQGGLVCVYIGVLQGGHAFRRAGSNGFWWPPDNIAARILRSPNRERAEVKDAVQDPMTALRQELKP